MQDARHSCEHAADRHTIVQERRDQPPDERHVGGSCESVSGDVADHNGQRAVVEDESLEPVATNGRRQTGRHVPCRCPNALDGRQCAQQAEMEICDQLVLCFVELGSLDDLGHEVRHRAQRLGQLEIEGR